MGSKTVTVYGVEGWGETAKEARADAVRKLEEAAVRDYTPRYIAWRGYLGLIFADLEGYTFAIMDPDKLSGSHTYTEYLYTGTHYSNRDEAESRMRVRLARQTWRREDGNYLPSILSTSYTLEEDRRDYVDWATVEARTLDYMDHGFERELAHTLARTYSYEEFMRITAYRQEETPVEPEANQE